MSATSTKHLKLTGQQLEALRNEIVGAFTLEQLRELVRVVLDKRLEQIVTLAQPEDHLAWELLEWAERQNQLRELLRGVKERRPHLNSLDPILLWIGLGELTGTEQSTVIHVQRRRDPDGDESDSQVVEVKITVFHRQQGRATTIPANLPPFDDEIRLTGAAIPYARGWKRVHTLSENMYRLLRKLYVGMTACRFGLYPGGRNGLVDGYTADLSAVRLYLDDLRGLAADPSRINFPSPLRDLADLDFCFEVFREALFWPSISQEFLDAICLVERIGLLFLGLLNQADQVLETYFSSAA